MVEGKPTISLVWIGHVDHGKSTTLGHLLYQIGAIDPRVMEKLKLEAAQHQMDSWKWAYILDSLPEERQRGITSDIAFYPFCHPLLEKGPHVHSYDRYIGCKLGPSGKHRACLSRASLLLWGWRLYCRCPKSFMGLAILDNDSRSLHWRWPCMFFGLGARAQAEGDLFCNGDPCITSCNRQDN